METMDLSSITKTKQEKESSKKSSSPSNGFTARYIDLNLANRVYKSFPQMPVDSETVEKIIKNFPNEGKHNAIQIYQSLLGQMDRKGRILQKARYNS